MFIVVPVLPSVSSQSKFGLFLVETGGLHVFIFVLFVQ